MDVVRVVNVLEPEVLDDAALVVYEQLAPVARLLRRAKQPDEAVTRQRQSRRAEPVQPLDAVLSDCEEPAARVVSESRGQEDKAWRDPTASKAHAGAPGASARTVRSRAIARACGA
jgi:hypothetical protein